MESTFISIQVSIAAPVSFVWNCFNAPEHITNWNFASPDWCCPSADNDLQVGGKRNTRMEARDGSFGFDFWGTYTAINEPNMLAITLGDERKMQVFFEEKDGITSVREEFEAESENPIEMQQAGWQAILDNFKKYTEEFARATS